VVKREFVLTLHPIMTTFGSRPRVTSNTYANGSNQNCGNVLTEMPSTRVVKPPGGASSFSLGWCNDSDESINQRRPGGQGFSGSRNHQSPTQQQRAQTSGGTRQVERYASHDKCQDPPYYSESMEQPFTGAPPEDSCTFGGRSRPSSNNYASGSNQNNGNVLTDVPTTRVIKPPGGASNLSFGWADDNVRPNTHHRHQDDQEHVEHHRPQSQLQHSSMHDFEDCQERMQNNRQSQQQHRTSDFKDQVNRSGVGPVFGQRVRQSSNAFAQGTNQNCGNVISDTPTTRINAPPGGASTLRLG